MAVPGNNEPVVDPVVEPVVDPTPEPTPDPAPDPNIALREELATAQGLNQQYAARLGEFIAKTEPDPNPPLTPRFDDETTSFVQKTADSAAERVLEAKISELTVNMEIRQGISSIPDSDRSAVEKMAESELAALKANPFYKDINTTIQTRMAVDAARVKYYSGKAGSTQKTAEQNAAANANRDLLNTTGVPKTDAAPVIPDDKAKFIADYKRDPVNMKLAKAYYGFSPGTPEFEERFNRTAEQAWSGTRFGSTIETAVQVLSGGKV